MRRLLVVLAAALLSSAVPARAQEPVPAGFFGVMADGPLTAGTVDAAAEYDVMRASGVETVRIVFDWARAQPQAGGPVDLSLTDRWVALAAARGIRTLPVVIHAPAWAKAPGGGYGTPPADPRDFAAFCAELARRYGPGGSFWATRPADARRPIRAWQLWNEPNLSTYWSEQPFARRYVRLLRAAGTQIRRVDPGATIITGGLTNGSRTSAWEALRLLYAAGARGAFDAVALHPYTATIGGVLETVRRARRVMARHGGTVPIWLTEISWSSGRGLSPDEYATWSTSPSGQAARVSTALTTLARHRRTLQIGHVNWYTWLSPAARRGPWSSYSGLSRLDAQDQVVRKPALAAYARTALRLKSRRRSRQQPPSGRAGAPPVPAARPALTGRR